MNHINDNHVKFEVSLHFGESGLLCAAPTAPEHDCWLYLFHDHLLLSAVTSYEKMYVEVYGLRLPLSFDYVVMDQ